MHQVGLILQPTSEDGLNREIHLMCCLAQNQCSISDLMVVITIARLSQGPALTRLEDKAIE